MGRKIVLFVGRLIYYKGVDVLVRAMEHVDADLVLIGRGPLEGQLREIAVARGLDYRTSFVSPQDEAELAAWYHAADVFVLPSVARSEAFGLVQIEAHAAGTPVVSTNLTTSVPYANLDGVTGLVVPVGSVQALADALRRLLGDDELRARLGEQAQQRALTAVHDPAHGGQRRARSTPRRSSATLRAVVADEPAGVHSALAAARRDLRERGVPHRVRDPFRRRRAAVQPAALPAALADHHGRVPGRELRQRRLRARAHGVRVGPHAQPGRRHRARHAAHALGALHRRPRIRLLPASRARHLVAHPDLHPARLAPAVHARVERRHARAARAGGGRRTALDRAGRPRSPLAAAGAFGCSA